MDNPILRRAAIERLSSPEQLDTLTQVTRPRAWVALAAAGVVLVAALIWGTFGVLPEVVEGNGILIHEGGIFNIQSLSGGLMDRLLVGLRARVSVGQPIAHISEPVLSASMQHAKVTLESLQRNRNASAPLLVRNMELDLGAITRELAQARQSVETARGRAAYFESRVTAERQALAAGLLTDDQVQSTLSQLAQARDQVIGSQAMIEQLKSRQVSVRNNTDQTIFALNEQVAAAQQSLERLEQQFDLENVIRSPYTGEIVELLTDAGEAITPGQAIARVELEDAPLQALVFVPGEGKRLSPGMVVQVLPEGIHAEEHGYILGKVVDVSLGPLSPQGINRYLRNDLLVQRFGAGGGAYLVRVNLSNDPRNRNGFRWTSGSGPNVDFGSGTLISSRIRVQEQRPIELVIPALRRILGD